MREGGRWRSEGERKGVSGWPRESRDCDCERNLEASEGSTLVSHAREGRASQTEAQVLSHVRDKGGRGGLHSENMADESKAEQLVGGCSSSEASQECIYGGAAWGEGDSGQPVRQRGQQLRAPGTAAARERRQAGADDAVAVKGIQPGASCGGPGR